jgi:hypothetical protein
MDDEGWTLVNPYLEQHPINYPIVIGVGDFAKLHGITAMPVTLLIDREGRIADSHVGVVVKSSWEREIRTLLQERAKKYRRIRSGGYGRIGECCFSLRSHLLRPT